MVKKSIESIKFAIQESASGQFANGQDYFKDYIHKKVEYENLLGEYQHLSHVKSENDELKENNQKLNMENKKLKDQQLQDFEKIKSWRKPLRMERMDQLKSN